MAMSSADAALLSPFREVLRKEGGRLMWVGVAFLLIGIVALIFPSVSSLVATIFVGWVLLFSGLVALFGSFSIRGAGPFFGALLFALLSIAAGVLMLAKPVTGEFAITLALGALFMVQGASELAMAFELRGAPGSGWLTASAVASIGLAIVVLAWPQSSAVLLGIIIGVNFISSGVAYLIVGSAARRELQP